MIKITREILLNLYPYDNVKLPDIGDELTILRDNVPCVWDRRKHSNGRWKDTFSILTNYKTSYLDNRIKYLSSLPDEELNEYNYKSDILNFISIRDRIHSGNVQENDFNYLDKFSLNNFFIKK